MVGAIPLIGPDLARGDDGDALKAIDPFQSGIDLAREVKNEDYLGAGIAELGLLARPIKAAEGFIF